MAAVLSKTSVDWNEKKVHKEKCHVLAFGALSEKDIAFLMNGICAKFSPSVVGERKKVYSREKCHVSYLITSKNLPGLQMHG